MNRPALRVVERTPPPSKPVAPERRFRSLFRKEARLEAELLETRRSIAALRGDYARKNRLLVIPSMDTLRRLFS